MATELSLERYDGQDCADLLEIGPTRERIAWALSINYS
jgi:hypothetical protein